MQGIKETHFNFPNQTGFYRGKVRDVYFFGDKMAVVATDRISAFDVVLPKPIPNKGAILNGLAAWNLRQTAPLVPNWLEFTPHPQVSFGKVCKPFAVEMVVRGYLAGHSAREYKAGKRIICGVEMPNGLIENDAFPTPIITPSTKAQEGHDEDISREEILARGIVPEDAYLIMESYALKLFGFGSQVAKERGLILVDTKYEFGWLNNEVYLIDEVHTPDSSRYFYAEGYAERQKKGEPQKQLSKEFVRQWLIENGFQGKEGQEVPEMSDAWIAEISGRYKELYENIRGEKFVNTGNTSEILGDIEQAILACLK